MGKIAQIHIEIQIRLSAGESPDHIANRLDIPIEWVLAVEKDMLEG